MKVKVEREVDIDRLLINLDEKSQCKDPGMAGYEVVVNKQLLRDAHDVIKQFQAMKPDLEITSEGLVLSYKMIHKC